MPNRVIGASAVPSIQDCPRRTAAKLFFFDIAEDFGLCSTPKSTALQVGKGLHAGIEWGLKLKLDPAASISIGREEHGDVIRTYSIADSLQDVVLDTVLNRTEEKPGGDFNEIVEDGDCTKDLEPDEYAAEQAKKMLPAVEELIHRTDPAAVEPELIYMRDDGWELRVHPDVIDTKGVIQDAKTGKASTPPSYQAQLGAQALVALKNGLDVNGLQVNYIRRLGATSKNVPELQVEQYDVTVSTAHAEDLLDRFLQEADAFFDRRSPYYKNPRVFPANPSSMLCDKKYCPAHGTEFCPLTQEKP